MFAIADVAQLVEQDFRKVKVGGSIPLIGLTLALSRGRQALLCRPADIVF